MSDTKDGKAWYTDPAVIKIGVALAALVVVALFVSSYFKDSGTNTGSINKDMTTKSVSGDNNRSTDLTGAQIGAGFAGQIGDRNTTENVQEKKP